MCSAMTDRSDPDDQRTGLSLNSNRTKHSAMSGNEKVVPRETSNLKDFCATPENSQRLWKGRQLEHAKKVTASFW